MGGAASLRGTDSGDGDTRGEGNFIVEVSAQEAIFSELVFNEIGPFEGESTLTTEGVGYVTVEVDGPWTLTVEY